MCVICIFPSCLRERCPCENNGMLVKSFHLKPTCSNEKGVPVAIYLMNARARFVRNSQLASAISLLLKISPPFTGGIRTH